ncbi:hypothetical protein AB0M47_29580 [Hamadaea sp. NPDC051192]|uniref:hypothetical protein n=1 Tax=Hamadaea sp. NPDC051192 TaxID=3154940 RepID=UPI00344393DD
MSQDLQTTLVHVWMAQSEEGLETARRRDMFVREANATTSEVGFHRLLEEYVGWTLPSVPNFAGGETRLYFEILFPLFFIEQKFGWSGVAPRVPTHYGVKEPLRRGVEFVLGLSTLETLRQREALRQEDIEIARSWQAAIGRAVGSASTEGFRIVGGSATPVVSSQRVTLILEASVDGEWVPLDAAMGRWRNDLALLSAVPQTAGERTSRSRVDLANAEAAVNKAGAIVRNLQEQLEFAQADQDAAATRRAQIENDKQRLQDVTKLRAIGGEFELPLIAEGRCPTCEQSVDNRDVATQYVSTIEDNIALLNAERVTLNSLQAAAKERADDIRVRLTSAESELASARDHVRLLRDELIGPSAAPSIADVQQRLKLETLLRDSERATSVVETVEEELDELATRLEDLRRRRRALDSSPMMAADVARLSTFRQSFTSQLRAYGLRSLSPNDVTIDDRTLLPVDDGFELSFDVSMGMSASDTIRTKWAYHTALMEAAREHSGSHHLGILVLDEPRQQETNRTSLASFLERLRDNSSATQIIYATSEDSALLSSLLSAIPHTSIPSFGPHLLDI